MEIIDQKKIQFLDKNKTNRRQKQRNQKIMEHFNLRVSRLIRIAYGDFNLGKLKPDEVIISPRGLGSFF